MKNILPLVLLLSSCSAIPTIEAQQSPRATQARQAGVTGTPTPNISGTQAVIDLQAAQTEVVAAWEAKRILEQDLLNERNLQIGATQTVEYIAVMQLQATQTQAAYVITRQPTDDFVSNQSNDVYKVRATQEAEYQAFQQVVPTLTAAAIIAESAPAQRVQNATVAAFASLALFALAILTVVVTLRSWSEYKKRNYDIALEIWERENKTLEDNNLIPIPDAPAPLVVTQSVKPAATEKLMPCTRDEWQAFSAKVAEGKSLSDKDWRASVFAVSGYALTRAVMTAEGLIEGNYASGSLALTAKGEKFASEWREGLVLPIGGYKFAEEK